MQIISASPISPDPAEKNDLLKLSHQHGKLTGLRAEGDIDFYPATADAGSRVSELTAELAGLGDRLARAHVLALPALALAVAPGVVSRPRRRLQVGKEERGSGTASHNDA